MPCLKATSRWLAFVLLAGVASLTAVSTHPSPLQTLDQNYNASIQAAPCLHHDSLAHTFDDGSLKTASHQTVLKSCDDEGYGKVQGTGAYDQADQQQHKRLMPLDAWDLVTFSACAVILLIAAGGGIGGGAVLVPLFILASGMSPQQHP